MTRACESGGAAVVDSGLLRALINVSTLLYNRGGWWSAGCAATAAMPPCMPRKLAERLVEIALATMTRDGELAVGFAEGRHEPLFRDPSSPANVKSPRSG